jgi:hypothetical protein
MIASSSLATGSWLLEKSFFFILYSWSTGKANRLAGIHQKHLSPADLVGR